MLDWVGRHNTGVIRTPLPPNLKKPLYFYKGFFLLKKDVGILFLIQKIDCKYWNKQF